MMVEDILNLLLRDVVCLTWIFLNHNSFFSSINRRMSPYAFSRSLSLHTEFTYEVPFGPLSSIDPCVNLTHLFLDQVPSRHLTDPTMDLSMSSSDLLVQVPCASPFLPWIRNYLINVSKPSSWIKLWYWRIMRPEKRRSLSSPKLFPYIFFGVVSLLQTVNWSWFFLSTLLLQFPSFDSYYSLKFQPKVERRY